MNRSGRQSCDVAIIGAGPSGATAAALLSRASLNVLVLEKQHFPRFSIGESLLPHCMDFLQQAGMLEAVEMAGFQFKNGAAFCRGDKYESFDFGSKFGNGWDHTYQVQRAKFDTILADQAARQGAEIRYGQTITGYREGASGAVLDVRDEENRHYQVEAGFVLDASGFGRVLARLLDLDKPSAFSARGSIFAHVSDGIDDPGFDRDKILIGIHPRQGEVWQWLIPFSGGRASIGVVAPPDYFEQRSGSDLDKLRGFHFENAHMGKLLDGADFDSPAGSITGYACAVDSLYGERFALLGNAGEFLDPVFSSGLTIAMKSSSLAVGLLLRRMSGKPVDWEREYAGALMHGVNVFRVFVGAWYEGRLQRIIFSESKSEEAKRMICAILAGYAWDHDNPYVRRPARLDTLYELCAVT